MNQGVMTRTDSPIDRAAELLRRKMTSLNGLSETLLRDVRALARDRVEISANRPIVKENERCPQIYLVESGWVFSQVQCVVAILKPGGWLLCEICSAVPASQEPPRPLC